MHIIVVILLVFISILADRYRNNKIIFYGGQLILVLYFTYIASFYGAVSTDHDGYVRDFHLVEGDSISSLFDQGILAFFGKSIVWMESGFYVLTLLCHKVGLGELGYFFVIALLINIFVIRYVYKNKFASLAFLFLLSVNFHLSESNIIRQMLAMAFLLPVMSYLRNNNVVKYFVGVVFSSLFHTSAIIFLIFVPLCYIKDSHLLKLQKIFKSVWILSLVLATGIIGFNFDSMLGLFGSNYETYAGTDNNVGTSNSISMVLLFNLLTFGAIKYDFHKNYHMVILVAFNAILLNLSLQNPNIARLFYYFIVIDYCYLSYFISNKTLFPAGKLKIQSLFKYSMIIYCLIRLLAGHILSDPLDGVIPYSWNSFFKN